MDGAMTHASIKNFVDVGDPSAPVGSPSWCRAAHVQLCATKRQTDWEVRHLKYGLLEFKQQERWRQLCDDDGNQFLAWEDYVQYPEPNGLGMPRESAKAVMDALNDQALLGEVMGQHGGDHGVPRVRDESTGRFVAQEPQPDNVRMTDRQYGNSRQDTIARLRRDRPELARAASVTCIPIELA